MRLLLSPSLFSNYNCMMCLRLFSGVGYIDGVYVAIGNSADDEFGHVACLHFSEQAFSVVLNRVFSNNERLGYFLGG